MNQCCYCNNNFSTKSSLQQHQKVAKYCLKKRGQDNKAFVCVYCNKTRSTKQNLEVHYETCKKYLQTQTSKKFETEIKYLKSQLFEKGEQLLVKDKIIQDLQNKLENIALKAVSHDHPEITT